MHLVAADVLEKAPLLVLDVAAQAEQQQVDVAERRVHRLPRLV